MLGLSVIPRKRWSSVLATLLLTGCAVGPDFKQPAAPADAGYMSAPLAPKTAGAPGSLGTAQNLVSGRDIPGQWWALFKSPQLNDLIERAFKANPSIAAAQAALKGARENMLAQQGTLFPSVGLDLSGSKNETSTASLAPVAANNQRIYSLYTGELTVSYSLDAFGLNRRTIEALAAQADTQRLELAAAYVTLSTNVVLAAIQEAGLRGQLAALHQTIQADTELRDILQREYALGEAAQADVLQQEAVLAQAQQLLPPLEKQLAQQRNALIALTGGFPNQDLGATFDLDTLSLPRDLPVSLPSSLVEHRPDILAAAATLHAASAQVGVAIANRLPQLSLTAALGTSPNAVASAFTPYNQFFTIIGKVAQPIFQGGALVHRQRQAQAAFDQAAAQYRSTVIAAYQNVADVLQGVQADARAVQAATAAEQAASRSLDLSRKELQLGSISYLSVLNAEQTYATARLTLIQAQTARLADSAALFQALGGGWWNR